MDISPLEKNDLEVWVQFTKDVRLKLRYMPRDVLEKIGKQATEIAFDLKSRQRTETVDGKKYDTLLCQKAVVDWEGLVNSGKPYPCTPENIEFLVNKWTGFAGFVARCCIDLEGMKQSEREALEKN